MLGLRVLRSFGRVCRRSVRLERVSRHCFYFDNATLSEYDNALRSLGPAFPIKKNEDITLLHSPLQFFQELKSGIQRAENRIVLSALYLGSEPKVEELVKELDNALSSKTHLSLVILQDYLRGTRNTSSDPHRKQSSLTLLSPLSNKFPTRTKMYYYHTPSLHSFWKSALPQRINEVVGVQHVKAFVFDDDLLISGANLSQQYLTDRQDRYMWIKNNNLVANYYSQLIDTIGSYSYHFVPPSMRQTDEDEISSLVLPSGVPAPDSFRSTKEFKSFAYHQMHNFLIEQDSKSKGQDNIEDVKTWVYPTLQFNDIGISHDSTVTQTVLENIPNNSELHLCSAYFNLTKTYENIILNIGRNVNINIIVAAPKQNGFYKSKGLSGYIPALYSEVLSSFYKLICSNQLSQNIKLFEYIRANWTFHAKGLWISLPKKVDNDTNGLITFIGSPNFGERSVNRDLESQIVLLTEDSQLCSKLVEERQNIFSEANPVTDVTFINDEDRKLSPFVLLSKSIVKKFM